MPLLIMLMLGLVTYGITFSQGIGLSNAVREGSRFAASTAAESSGDTLDWADWTADVVSRTRTVQGDDSGNETTICVRLLKNTSEDTAVPSVTVADFCSPGSTAPVPSVTAPTPPAVPSNSCFVMVWGGRNFHLDAFVFQHDGTLERQSLARYERTC
jgi:Flp pilus assembly protein TadG